MNPIALIICYVVVALTSVILLDPQVTCHRQEHFVQSFLGRMSQVELNPPTQMLYSANNGKIQNLIEILFVSLSLAHNHIATLIRIAYLNEI
jgi:hypothetical protein